MLLVPIMVVAVITITIMLMMITVSKAGPRKATYKAMIRVIDPIMMLDRPLGVRTTITMISKLMTLSITILIYIRAVKMHTLAMAMVIVVEAAMLIITPKIFTTMSKIY